MESGTALITGAFTLGGVLVGGFLNNWLSYVLERRRQGWTGTTRARLFMPRMSRLSIAIGEALEYRLPWADLCEVVESNIDGFWTDFADAFAGTFSFDEWQTIYKAVRSLEHLTYNAPRDGTRVAEKDAEYLHWLSDHVVEATASLIAIGFCGPNRRRRLRRAFWTAWSRLRPLDEDKLLREAGPDPAELDATERR